MNVFINPGHALGGHPDPGCINPAEHLRECDEIEELNRKLLEENTRVPMDQDAFMKKYNSYVERYEEEAAKAGKLQKQLGERQRKADMLSEFMFEVHEQNGMIDEFDEKLWLSTVEQVKVFHDGRMAFIFKNGTEVTR